MFISELQKIAEDGYSGYFWKVFNLWSICTIRIPDGKKENRCDCEANGLETHDSGSFENGVRPGVSTIELVALVVGKGGTNNKFAKEISPLLKQPLRLISYTSTGEPITEMR